MAFIWDGITKSSSLKAPELAKRHQLTNAAKQFQWDEVFKLLDSHPSLVNCWRPDGRSFYTPLHQAAYSHALPQIINDLIQRGAWRSLLNTQGERPVDIATKKGYDDLVPLLEPEFHMHIDTQPLLQIEAHFHALIKQRVEKLVSKENLRLPQLSILLEHKTPKMWFPVPGMYGGFEYQLVLRHNEPLLLTSSWIRVVQGSGQKHAIDSQGSHLVEKGFV